MRISDWSSDVCSSDLHLAGAGGVGDGRAGHAGEDDALEDVDLGEPTAEAADEGVAEAQQPVGHGADVHQLRREDEQRHRQDDVVGVHAVEYLLGGGAHRSEERSVGKAWGSTCRSRWSPKNEKKK